MQITITNTEAHSYRNRDPHKVLALREKEKKDKHLASCHETRKDFIPMVYSIDEVVVRKAKAGAEKQLASFLASKWRKDYSQIYFM